MNSLRKISKHEEINLIYYPYSAVLYVVLMKNLNSLLLHPINKMLPLSPFEK